MNTRVSTATKKTPFEIVFGQLPNNLNTFAYENIEGIIQEEDMENMLPGSTNTTAINNETSGTTEPTTNSNTPKTVVPTINKSHHLQSKK